MKVFAVPLIMTGGGPADANEVPWVKMKPGAGPRHVVFHPGGQYAFLINEP